MVNVKKVAQSISRWSLLKYFPSDADGRAALVEMVCGIIETDEQAEWLAKRVLAIYNEWPGPQEIRATFCGRFRPSDGINAYSQVYQDGLPPDPEAAPRIEAPKLLELPEGHCTSVDAECEQMVVDLAKETAMPTASPFAQDRATKLLRETITAPRDRPELPPPTPQIINQADIDRAVAGLRAKAAS